MGGAFIYFNWTNIAGRTPCISVGLAFQMFLMFFIILINSFLPSLNHQSNEYIFIDLGEGRYILTSLLLDRKTFKNIIQSVIYQTIFKIRYSVFVFRKNAVLLLVFLQTTYRCNPPNHISLQSLKKQVYHLCKIFYYCC